MIQRMERLIIWLLRAWLSPIASLSIIDLQLNGVSCQSSVQKWGHYRNRKPPKSRRLIICPYTTFDHNSALSSVSSFMTKHVFSAWAGLGASRSQSAM